MRDHPHEEDAKAPRPARRFKKRSNPSEASEAIPVRQDDDRDRHRHRI